MPAVSRVAVTTVDAGFERMLATRGDPSFLAPLGHHLLPDAPGGSVRGLAAVSPVVQPAPVERSFASPSVTHQQWISTAPSTSAAPAPAPAPAERNAMAADAHAEPVTVAAEPVTVAAEPLRRPLVQARSAALPSVVVGRVVETGGSDVLAEAPVPDAPRPEGDTDPPASAPGDEPEVPVVATSPVDHPAPPIAPSIAPSIAAPNAPSSTPSVGPPTEPSTTRPLTPPGIRIGEPLTRTESVVQPTSNIATSGVGPTVTPQEPGLSRRAAPPRPRVAIGPPIVSRRLSDRLAAGATRHASASPDVDAGVSAASSIDPVAADVPTVGAFEAQSSPPPGHDDEATPDQVDEPVVTRELVGDPVRRPPVPFHDAREPTGPSTDARGPTPGPAGGVKVSRLEVSTPVTTGPVGGAGGSSTPAAVVSRDVGQLTSLAGSATSAPVPASDEPDFTTARHEPWATHRDAASPATVADLVGDRPSVTTVVPHPASIVAAATAAPTVQRSRGGATAVEPGHERTPESRHVALGAPGPHAAARARAALESARSATSTVQQSPLVAARRAATSTAQRSPLVPVHRPATSTAQRSPLVPVSRPAPAPTQLLDADGADGPALDLRPVEVTESGVLQRQVEATAAPEPDEAAAPPPEPAPAAAPVPTPTAAPARTEADLQGLFRALYPVLHRRLCRDLLLDRERAGYRTDIRF